MRSGQGPDAHVVAVVGDGALTGGVAFEAVHQAGGLGTPIVVLLNDNGMSIAPNVGALSRYFNRIRLNPKLWHAREDIEGGLTKLPAGIGAAFERFGPYVKESIKAFWAPNLWWEELDFAYIEVFGNALVGECKRDERIMGITAAMNSGTGLNILQHELPDRYFDVGIAEQQAVLFAAGLALQGCKPVAAIYSTFLQRAYDQIVHDVCLQRLNVVFAMDRAGLVGDDGPTHHGAFDIAYLRCLPNIVLMAPREEAMLVHMLHTALTYDDGPIALRYPRGEGVGVPLPRRALPLQIGTGEILREGERVALLGYGTGVGKALEAADILAERGMAVTVADARFAKPIDAGLAAQLAAEHDLLVTVEEGVLAGGFGSAGWGTPSDARLPPRVLRLGLPDRHVAPRAPKLPHPEGGFHRPPSA